ncbi:MAG: tetratricopeptide repeat protein, partial [Alkalispirochaeta sp.]
MRQFLLVTILTGITVLSSCGPAQPPTEPSRFVPDDLISALSTGDHRLLDEFDPTDGAVEGLRRQRADGPYILGRALERRGRDAAAEWVYRSELAAGATRWAGLSAVRLAVLSAHQGNLTAAQGHAQSAVDLVPEFRDGWMALGTSVYRRDDYSALQEIVERLPPEPDLFAAERVSARELSAEAALWRAVAAWETG